MVIAGPGLKPGFKPGQRSDRVVGLIDLHPTLLDLCDLPANPKHEGRSLKPLLKHPDLEWPHAVLTGWKEKSFAIQTETHRHIRYGNGSEELYDQRKELKEWTNLAGTKEHEAVRKELATEMDRQLGR